MATTKAKTKRRRKSSVGSVAATKTFGGKRYQHKTCSTSKRTAQKIAEDHRAKGKGKTARVVKNGSKFCVYTRG